MNRTSQKRGFNALKVGSIWLFLLILMAALSLVAVSVGSAGYSVGEILRAVFSGEESTIKVIIFNLRLPRLLLALLIGASLSASGALLQSVMRNPLADPGTIGVSAGAGTAATTILLLFPHLTNSVPIFAFGGAALACALSPYRDSEPFVREGMRLCDFSVRYGCPFFPLKMAGMERILSVSFSGGESPAQVAADTLSALTGKNADLHYDLRFGGADIPEKIRAFMEEHIAEIYEKLLF